jgi:hypothetical protein
VCYPQRIISADCQRNEKVLRANLEGVDVAMLLAKASNDKSLQVEAKAAYAFENGGKPFSANLCKIPARTSC